MELLVYDISMSFVEADNDDDVLHLENFDGHTRGDGLAAGPQHESSEFLYVWIELKTNWLLRHNLDDSVGIFHLKVVVTWTILRP